MVMSSCLWDPMATLRASSCSCGRGRIVVCSCDLVSHLVEAAITQCVPNRSSYDTQWNLACCFRIASAKQLKDHYIPNRQEKSSTYTPSINSLFKSCPDCLLPLRVHRPDVMNSGPHLYPPAYLRHLYSNEFRRHDFINQPLRPGMRIITVNAGEETCTVRRTCPVAGYVAFGMHGVGGQYSKAKETKFTSTRIRIPAILISSLRPWQGNCSTLRRQTPLHSTQPRSLTSTH